MLEKLVHKTKNLTVNHLSTLYKQYSHNIDLENPAKQDNQKEFLVQVNNIKSFW